jgi:hypothetical protein
MSFCLVDCPYSRADAIVDVGKSQDIYRVLHARAPAAVRRHIDPSYRLSSYLLILGIVGCRSEVTLVHMCVAMVGRSLQLNEPNVTHLRWGTIIL